MSYSPPHPTHYGHTYYYYSPLLTIGGLLPRATLLRLQRLGLRRRRDLPLGPQAPHAPRVRYLVITPHAPGVRYLVITPHAPRVRYLVITPHAPGVTHPPRHPTPTPTLTLTLPLTPSLAYTSYTHMPGGARAAVAPRARLGRRAAAAAGEQLRGARSP